MVVALLRSGSNLIPILLLIMDCLQHGPIQKHTPRQTESSWKHAHCTYESKTSACCLL